MKNQSADILIITKNYPPNQNVLIVKIVFLKTKTSLLKFQKY